MIRPLWIGWAVGLVVAVVVIYDRVPPDDVVLGFIVGGGCTAMGAFIGSLFE